MNGKFQVGDEVYGLKGDNYDIHYEVMAGPFIDPPVDQSMPYYAVISDTGHHHWMREDSITLAPIIWTERQKEELRVMWLRCKAHSNLHHMLDPLEAFILLLGSEES